MGLLYPIRGRKYYYITLDIAIIVGSFFISYLIRFFPDLETEAGFLSPIYHLIIVCSYMISFYLFQIYRIMWAYSNISDVYKLMIANISGFLLFTAQFSFFNFRYSRIVVVLFFMFVAVGTIFYRILIRDYYSKKNEYAIPDNTPGSEEKNFIEKRILVVGAGEAGRIILSEYRKKGIEKSIIGFVDDDISKIGKIFNGKSIFASTGEIPATIRKHSINEIIIAMPSVNSENINRIVTLIKNENQMIPIKTIPPLMELVDEENLTVSLRNITIADLIGREEFSVDSDIIKNKFSGKTILITGAGGSIGSEICKQLLKFDVKKIICVGRGEFSIYSLVKTLSNYLEYRDVKPELVYRIIDIKDKNLLNKTFQEHSPQVVFHAAAHKHVPMMEFNEIEAIQNNVMGTWNVLDLSSIHGVEEFVLVSTDKAVNPTNIMGATKRLAELITGYFSRYRGLKTAIVRFGNVLGSRGSVIPLFKEQIEKGGPVTVTHPDITRYFMSIPEASLLVINAAAYSRGGELFVLDMGKQYRILDIVKRLIELYGYRPDEDIKIQFTGLRPGEKMYEELFYDRDTMTKTENEKIFMVSSDTYYIEKDVILKFINEEMACIGEFNSLQIRQLLNRLIPGYIYADVCSDLESCSRLVI